MQTEISKADLARIMREDQSLEPEAFSLLTSDSEADRQDENEPELLTMNSGLDIADYFARKPLPREYILEDLLPAGITAVLNSPGGVGKSNLTLLMSMIVAAGVSIGPFTTKEPKRVLLLNVEDSADDLHRRVYAIGQVYPSLREKADVIKGNLVLYSGRGTVTPFMRFENGNPVVSPSGTWIKRSMLEIRPDLAIFDTKSRLFGLDENSNDHAAQWWQLFESMMAELPGCTVLVASHTGKANYGDNSQVSNRGASAFIDNARQNLVLNHLPENTAKTLEVDRHSYFQMTVAKTNYTQSGTTFYFEKVQEGVPRFVDLKAERLSAALDALIDGLNELPDKEIGKRELEQGAAGKPLRDAIKSASGLTKNQIGSVTYYGIDSLVLELEERSCGRGKPSTFIKLKNTVEESDYQGTAYQKNLFNNEPEG